MQTVRLPANNWQPRPYQSNLWTAFENGVRRLIEIAHRRWGKDELALNMAAVAIFQDPATYWHMLPEYSQAKKAIWNAINPHTGIRRIDEAFPKELRENTNEHEMFIRFINGATWQVVGSDSYKSLVGAPPKGIVFSEWAKANPAAWAYLAPILEENGGWALFITTPEGKNHACAMYNMAKKNPRWFAELQTVEHTGFPIDRVDEARKEYHALYGIEAGDALIEQEYYCSFEAAILGAVYGKQMAHLVKDGKINDRVKHDPNYPVYTAHDMGYDDAHAIIFFQIGVGELLVIDYEEGHGWDPRNVCERLSGRKIIVAERDLESGSVLNWEYGDDIEEIAHRRQYKYDILSHHVPWDANIKRQDTGGKSTVEQCSRFGFKMNVHMGAAQAVDEAALRMVLPKCWFTESSTGKLVEALTSYHRKWDDDKKKFKDAPEHDGSSHGADAAELMAKVYNARVVTVSQVESREVITEFNRRRAQNKIDKSDPYRVKPMRKK